MEVSTAWPRLIHVGLVGLVLMMDRTLRLLLLLEYIGNGCWFLCHLGMTGVELLGGAQSIQLYEWNQLE